MQLDTYPQNLPPFLENGVPDPVFLNDILALTHLAADAVMEVYTSAFNVKLKDDRSPVTEADTRAEAIILEGLRRLTPSIPIISEEAMSEAKDISVSDQPFDGDLFWLVDPVDGTKQFVARNGEFTVNIGLVQNGVPVFGVVCAPAIESTWWGGGPGTAHLQSRQGKRRVIARPVPPEGATVITSRSHATLVETDELLRALLKDTPIVKRLITGSSLKFCRLADAQADIYPRVGPTSEWDTCAGHAVLQAAGGSVRNLDGTPMRYGKRRDFINEPFVAFGLGW